MQFHPRSIRHVEEQLHKSQKDWSLPVAADVVAVIALVVAEVESVAADLNADGALIHVATGARVASLNVAS